MKKLVIRYGVFAILAIMFAGIAFITDGLELQDKKAVSIVVGKSGCRIYMDRDGSALPSPGDTLYIVQTRHGDMKFVADTAWAESASAVVRSRPAPRQGENAGRHIFAGLHTCRQKEAAPHGHEAHREIKRKGGVSMPERIVCGTRAKPSHVWPDIPSP